MSNFWSAWIIAGSLIVIFGCAYLLRMVIVDTMGEEGKEMSHKFDGIVEMNNPLPRWWTIMFVVSIIWGLGYFIVFGLGSYQGIIGWKSANKQVYSLADSKAQNAASRANNELVQYVNELDTADAVYGKTYAKYAAMSVDELMQDEEALKVGQRLFIQNCAQCHGSDARGQRGFPNLTDNDWLFGGSFDKIKETINDGRISTGMIAWKDALGGDEAVKDVVTYVRSLSGRSVNTKDAEAGKLKFGLCAGCHGIDGKGNQALGAPNLTDNIWLYGGSTAAITDSVAKGRAGVMPPWRDILGEDKVHVLSAYVYSLSNKK
jgi:cytochrome c oxidase cbb3-type subunit 3